MQCSDNTIPYNTTQHNTTQHNTIQYNSLDLYFTRSLLLLLRVSSMNLTKCTSFIRVIVWIESFSQYSCTSSLCFSGSGLKKVFTVILDPFRHYRRIREGQCVHWRRSRNSFYSRTDLYTVYTVICSRWTFLNRLDIVHMLFIWNYLTYFIPCWSSRIRLFEKYKK